MYTYELLTPNEPITFKAKSDKIAMACALVLGQGQAGARRFEGENEIKIPSLTIFNHNASKDIESFLETSLANYLKDNEQDMADCFDSFAYTTLSTRDKFDTDLAKLTNEKAINEFKQKHERKNKTSMSQWVQSAWSFGRALSNKKKMEIISKN